jgi:predicted  nucleic acid-binding Zn-ribbon protein
VILESTLFSLIELQEIDLKLDKVEEERGDLPSIVDTLYNSIEQKERLLGEQKDEIHNLKLEQKNCDLELNSYKEQLKKYENQLYQVKTNKEYDAISNETENVKKKIQEYENKVFDIEEAIENFVLSNEAIEKELFKLKKEYEESNTELQEKISSSSEEENILRQERKIVEQKLSTQQIQAYERIRRANKGVAVAYVNGGVCSGCFAFVPPQKIVEIRNMKKLYYCESCGRILVWDRNV